MNLTEEDLEDDGQLLWRSHVSLSPYLIIYFQRNCILEPHFKAGKLIGEERAVFERRRVRKDARKLLQHSVEGIIPCHPGKKQIESVFVKDKLESEFEFQRKKETNHMKWCRVGGN